MAKHDSGEPASASMSPGASVPAHFPVETGLDPAQLWSTLRQNAKLILWVAGSFALGVVTLTFGAHMEFLSKGRLYLGELESKAKSSGVRPGDLDFAASDSSDLGSEIQILQSASVLDTAIKAAGVNVTLLPAGWKPPRYLSWRLAKRDLKRLDAGLREVTPSGAALDDDSRGVREFTVKFLTTQIYELRGEDGARLGQGKLGEPFKARGVSLTLAPGAERSPSAGAEYELAVKPLDETKREVVKALAIGYPKALSQAEVVRVISLDYVNRSPLLAQRFLRALMNGYLEERRSWKTEDASAAETFVTNQLKLIRESLDKTEKRLAEYRSTNRVVVLDNEARAMIEQIGKYEEQRVAARLQLATLADVRRALKNPHANMEAFLAGGANDPVLDGLTKTLSESRQDLASLQGRFQEDAPDIRERRAELDAQLQVIRNYVDSRHARAQDSLGTMNQIISQFEDKLKTVPGAELGLAQLARESEVYSKMYSYLLERQQQAAIVKASTVSKNRILDAPELPYKEHSPSLVTRAVVSLFGLVLGVAAVIVHLVFSTTLQTENDVRRFAGGIPIFASVPRRTAPAKRNKLEPAFDVLAEAPASPFAEAFRMLRANLYQLRSQSEGNVVLITSPRPGDGKSTSAMALAVMLAADSKSVLLVDADVRKPSHHSLLRQPLEPGLSDVLTRRCDWLSTTRPVSTAYGDFYALTGGRAAPSELLSSESMATFLAQAKQRFDFVIIDCASFPLVSDVLVLSPHANCVISVLRLGHTPKKLAATHMRRVAGRVSEYGVIVNGAHPSDGYGYLANEPGQRIAGAAPARSAS